MAQVTGSIGNQPVELNNAATESTLAQLLSIMQRVAPQQARALQQIANSSGISPAAIKSAEDALRELGDAADRATSTVGNSFTRLPNMITPVFADLTSGLINTTKNLADFAMTAVNGTNTVAGLLRAFEQLPLGLGLIASLFRNIVEFNQPAVDAFRNLSDVGLSTSDIFNVLQESSTQLGLSVEETNTLLKQNSETFAMMGVSAGKGADAFLKFAREANLSRMGILQLGFTLPGFNQGMLDFISITGSRTESQMNDIKSLTESTRLYLGQLDKLSQLTGKSREEMSRQLKEAAMNEAVRARLMSLEPAERTKFAVSLQNAMISGGKGAMDALKSEILGIAPATDEARKFTALNAEAAAAIRQSARDSLDTSKTVGDINKSGAAALKATSDRITAMGPSVVSALSMLNTANSDTVMKMQAVTNLLRSKGLNSVEDILDFMNKQEPMSAEVVQQMLEMETANLQIRESAQTAMRELSKALTPMITKGLVDFATAIKDINWKDFGESLKAFSINVIEFGKNMLTEEGRAKIAQDISEQFAKIFDKVLESLKPDWWKFLRTSPYELGKGMRVQLGMEPAPSTTPMEGRQIGSLGATGKLFEDFGAGTPVMLHGKESVITPEQMGSVINSAVSTNNARLLETMQNLKSQNDAMLVALNNIADNTRKTFGATRNLDTNLFVR